MFSLLVLLTVSQPAVDTPSPAPTLTIDQAVAAAKRNHPSLRVAQARTAGAHARADQARAPLRPSIDFSARHNVNLSSPFDANIHGRSSYNAGLSGGILLYDFNRTRNRYDAAKVSARAQKHSEHGVAQDVALDARVAFINAHAAKQVVIIARERLVNENRHLAQVRASSKSAPGRRSTSPSRAPWWPTPRPSSPKPRMTTKSPRPSSMQPWG